MSKVIVTESHLEDIADAIREKLGVETTYRPGDMAAAIESIRGDLEALTARLNGVYVPTDPVDGYDEVTVQVPTFSASVVTDAVLLSGEQVSVVQDGVAINTAPIYVQKTITENGTYDPGDDNAQAYSGVVVNVQGISYGTSDPLASAGSDGDVYFKYRIVNMYDSLLPDGDYDLDNWEKNAAAFTQFDNTCVDGENTLIQTGGNGYERVFVPVTVDANTDYVFAMKYYSPSGVASGYSGQIGFGVSFASESSMRSSSAVTLDSRSDLSRTAESDYSDFSVSFNSGNHTSAYLVIDLNITDGSQCTLKFKDIVFYKDGEPPVQIDNDIISSAYLKQDGAWVNAIGAVIDLGAGT